VYTVVVVMCEVIVDGGLLDVEDAVCMERVAVDDVDAGGQYPVLERTAPAPFLMGIRFSEAQSTALARWTAWLSWS
jgi:hypothetical protein